MAVLEILLEPDFRLRKKSLDVEVVDDRLRRFMDDMVETMYADNGIGLAAPQVNVHKKILVIDLQEVDNEERPKGFFPLYIVNPKILELSTDLVETQEGCLSVPEQFIDVIRPEGIKIEYLDYNGDKCTLQSKGWLSRVIQHEMDHLEGKLIIDYLSPVKRSMVVKKLMRIKKSI